VRSGVRERSSRWSLCGNLSEARLTKGSKYAERSGGNGCGHEMHLRGSEGISPTECLPIRCNVGNEPHLFIGASPMGKDAGAAVNARRR
jgi:hypothetical protein